MADLAAAPAWATSTYTDDGVSYWQSTPVEVAGARLWLAAGGGVDGDDAAALQLEASADRYLDAAQTRELAAVLLDHADRLDRG